jgi:hypothetical protein
MWPGGLKVASNASIVRANEDPYRLKGPSPRTAFSSNAFALQDAPEFACPTPD